MTTEEFDNLPFKIVEQARPVWNHHQYFTDKGGKFPVTFLICQRNTKVATQLAIESLLRFYPDINILVIDEYSDDDSLLYLKYKELTTPNLNVWFRQKEDGFLGHGTQMDVGIVQYVKTEYVMLMDSDVIIERSGFVEEMLQRFSENSKLYAIGTTQPTSYSNNGGEPHTLEDAIPYANPQLSLYHVPTYHELVEQGTDSRGVHVPAPFLTDGTPCILNMKAAFDAKLDVEYFPTDLYASHCGGSSWTSPRTVWIDDHDVKIRPFLTIIIRGNELMRCEAGDYDMVVVEQDFEGDYIFTDGSSLFHVDKGIFYVRHRVTGEYVLDFTNVYSDAVAFTDDFVRGLKVAVIENKIPDEIELHGLKFYKRQYWQKIAR